MNRCLRTLLVWTALSITPSEAWYDKVKATEPESVQSETPWNARRVEHEGAILHVLVPAEPTAEAIPLTALLENRGKTAFQCGESGYLLDCKLTLTAADGSKVPYTTPGSNLFSDMRQGGQYANFEYTRGGIRRWHYDLSAAFQPLRPGRYNLTLETTIYFLDPATNEFATPLKLVAKHLAFDVKDANGPVCALDEIRSGNERRRNYGVDSLLAHRKDMIEQLISILNAATRTGSWIGT